MALLTALSLVPLTTPLAMLPLTLLAVLLAALLAALLLTLPATLLTTRVVMQRAIVWMMNLRAVLKISAVASWLSLTSY